MVGWEQKGTGSKSQSWNIQPCLLFCFSCCQFASVDSNLQGWTKKPHLPHPSSSSTKNVLHSSQYISLYIYICIWINFYIYIKKKENRNQALVCLPHHHKVCVWPQPPGRQVSAAPSNFSSSDSPIRTSLRELHWRTWVSLACGSTCTWAEHIFLWLRRGTRSPSHLSLPHSPQPNEHSDTGAFCTDRT